MGTPYQLVPASIGDQEWLERLRRDVYQELFFATWGGWDEARHARHVAECWKRGGLWIIHIDGARTGMIQLLDQPAAVEIGEIQIHPAHQNLGVGTRVLRDIVARAHQQHKKVSLSVALKNDRAYQLYQRLGFRQVARTDTHNHMACYPTA